MGEEEEKEDQQQHEEGSPKNSDCDNGNGNGNKKSGGGGGGNNNGQKKKGGGGGGGGGGEEKKSITIVLRSDFHCLGCSIRLKKSILAFPGVDMVKEGEENKVTVIGTGIDPVKLRDSVEKKIKRKVELVFPQPPKNGGGGGNKNNGAGGGDKKAEEKQQDNNNNNKKANKEPPVTTVVLKVAYHCLGCGQKIHKMASTFKGVHTVTVDKDKDQVTVKGTMDAKALMECLKEKLKRPVEIIPEKKDNKDKNKESGTGDEKGNNQGGNAGNGGGGGGKKKGGGNVGGGGGGDDHENGGNGNKGNGGNGKNDGGAAANKLEYMVQGTGYVCREASSGYVVDILHAPQWFSEENANGCVVM
ncbi:Heavy metal-associated isoprenylated plant protein 3-like protein [Drosera capensis]